MRPMSVCTRSITCQKYPISMYVKEKITRQRFEFKDLGRGKSFFRRVEKAVESDKRERKR